ncbi:MAG: uncharacterized protein QOK29_997 [Rhodospirillaceae bacterium]|jgi:uncharacterized protein|nr:uncharacterized protein [Rhodospirillaceae bacterium]
MQFAIYCLDKSGHGQLRADNRAAHLEYLKKFSAHVISAGPLLDDAGSAMIGSLLLMEFPDRAAVERFAAEDPYAKAGLFASVRITPWRKVLPQG